MIDTKLLIAYSNRATELDFSKLKAATQLNVSLLNLSNGIEDNEITTYITKSLISLANNPPSCNVGHFHSFPLIASSIALAKRQEYIWNGLSANIQKKLALIMKAFAYGSAFITFIDNKYMTGPDFKGNVYKGWSPNYRLSLFPQLIYAADFFGGKEKLDSLLINFSYDEFIAELEEEHFETALALWTTESPTLDDGTKAPTIKQLMEEGGDAYITDQFGNVLSANGGVGIKHPYSYRDKINVLPDVTKLVSFTYNGGAIKSKIDIDEDGTFDAYIVDGTTSPEEGKEGMMTEFKQATGAGAYRSSVRYCAIDFMLATSLIATSKVIGYYDLKAQDPELYNKTVNGNNDLFYKAEHGYHGLGLTIRTETGEDLCNAFGYDIWKNYWLENR